MKTPLSVIIWVPDLLESENNLSPGQLDTLKIMKQASSSLLKMMNNSINLIKMERGEYQVQSEPVNVLKPLAQIRNEMSGLMRTKDLDLQILFNSQVPGPDDTFVIEGEEILFYSMLTNLIKNAIEASPPNQTVYVSLLKNEQNIIRIQNKGVVPEQIRERFFDKYVTASKRTGTGLGTYSARLITETMNGTISMKTGNREGTMVKISFS